MRKKRILPLFAVLALTGCMQGLLVKLPDTSTGYAITNEEANKQRDILGE